MTGRASTDDPLKVFRYRIEVDGITRAGFSEMTGLSKTTDVAEYREGGMNETPQKSAGLSKFTDVVLRRGQISHSIRGGDDDFIDWLDQVNKVGSQGNAENYRRNLDVVQFSSLNQEVRRWRITNAFPSASKPFSDLNASASDNSIEELTLSHEGYELVRRP
jgi:phage tail-like protein